MQGGGARGALPLRAMLQNELLDTAVVLFRARARPLLLIAAPLMAGEQVAAWYAGASLLDTSANFSVWWRVIATVFAGDAVTVSVLGAYAGAAAVPELLGTTARVRTRLLPALITAALPAVLLAAGAYFGLLGWIVVHGFLGLSGVAIGLDRAAWPFGALGRSVALAWRLSWRGFWTRLRAYAIWLGLRVALAAGPVAFLWQAGLAAEGYLGAWPVLMVWGLAGTVSCSALACFDAVVVIDTRIRTEGLDVEVRRAVANGVDPARVMPHTRPPSVPPMQVSAQPSIPPWPQALVRPSVPPGLSRQAQLQWMQAQARAEYEEGRES